MSEVQTTLNFVPDGASTETITQLDELYQRFSDKRSVTIKDVRDVDTQFTLDVHGFEFFKRPLPDMSVVNQESIENVLYPDAIDFVKTTLGASKAKIFEYQHRTAHSDNQSEKTGERGPSYVVHVDHSRAGAYKILCDSFPPEEVARLTKTRWALFNIWRPLARVEKDPLALCDAQTAMDEDLKEFFVNLLDESAAGDKYKPVNVHWSAIFCKYAARQKWYYMSDMMPDDLICFKIFDTKDDNKVWCMHSAFSDPKTADCPRARQSIELRCFVFFEDEPLE